MNRLIEERQFLDEQISLAGMLLLLDEISADAEVKGDLLDKMFEKTCLDE